MSKENTKRELPSGWRWVKLGEVCSRIRNGTTATQNQDTTGIPVTRIETISTGNIDLNRLGRIEKPIDSLSEYMLEVGDILFSHINSVERLGNCAIYEGIPENLLHGMNLLRLELKRDIVFPEFILWCLRSEGAIAFYRDNARRAIGQASLNTKDISALLLPLPSLAEQKIIAGKLREKMKAVGKARTAAEARLEAAERLPIAFMEQYLGGVEASGWPSVSMADVCKIVAPQVDPKLPAYRNLPHVNGENIEIGTGRIFGIKSAAEDGMTSGKYLFEPGVVLYSKLRPYLRKATVVNFRGLCSADMYPLTCDPVQVDPRFVLWVLLSRSFTEYAVSQSQRARMPKLNRHQLLTWKFSLPSLALQQWICEKIDQQMNTTQRAIFALREELQTINILPATLLHRAFNGEL